MSKFLASVFLVSTFIVLIGYQNCGMQQLPSQQSQDETSPTSGQSMKITGTVENPGFDGCHLLVHTIDNVTGKEAYFNPIGLKDPNVFAVGNVVEMQAIARPDMNGICMKGEIVQVTDAHVVTPAP